MGGEIDLGRGGGLIGKFRLLRYGLLVVWGLLTRQSVSVRLRHEFNLWAERRHGEGMERSHRFFTERILDKMNLGPGDRILDLGCGEGWAARLIASRIGKSCRVVGLDISDEMIRRARAKSAQYDNVTFLRGSAEQIPWEGGFFTKVLGVESFYYFENQEQALGELLRVMVPGGQLFLLVCIYKDHPASVGRANRLRVPVHVRSVVDHKDLLEAQGWVNVRTEEFAREYEPEHEPGFHARGLLVTAERPAAERPATAFLSAVAHAGD